MAGWFPDIFLPFWLPLDRLREVLPPGVFRYGLTAAFLGGAGLLFFTRRPRAGCLVLAGVIFLASLASRTFYGNNRIFAACLFLLAGLWEPGLGSLALRLQVSVIYFGAALNKLMNADWLSGRFFHYKIVSFFPYLPGAAEGRWIWAARLLCWGTIALEFGLFAGFLVRRLNRAAIWAGLAFHALALVLFRTDFGLFTVAVGASYLLFVKWPEPPTAEERRWRYRPAFYYGLTALLCLIGFFLASGSARASEIVRGGPERVSLLEVFSSEGCSSCPPAEEWVGGLRKNGGLWKTFVPAVFHVDYWDRLGWKDPYSRKAYTDRQYRYASSWGADGVYTPGFVLNGRERRDRPLDRLPGGNAGILTAERAGGEFLVRFEPSGETGPYRVHAALLGFGLATDVKAGENAGRRLVHDFTVLDFRESDLAARDGGFEAALSLSDGGVRAESLGLAVWVTRADDLEPLQAAGAYL
jgi:hypothetical protein